MYIRVARQLLFTFPVKVQPTPRHHRYQVIHESLAPVELAWDPLSGLDQPIGGTSKVDVGFLLSPIFEYLIPRLSQHSTEHGDFLGC